MLWQLLKLIAIFAVMYRYIQSTNVKYGSTLGFHLDAFDTGPYIYFAFLYWLKIRIAFYMSLVVSSFWKSSVKIKDIKGQIIKYGDTIMLINQAISLRKVPTVPLDFNLAFLMARWESNTIISMFVIKNSYFTHMTLNQVVLTSVFPLDNKSYFTKYYIKTELGSPLYGVFSVRKRRLVQTVILRIIFFTSQCSRYSLQTFPTFPECRNNINDGKGTKKLNKKKTSY